VGVVRAKKDKELVGEEELEGFEEFHPTFTYPVGCFRRNWKRWTDLVVVG